MMLFSTRARWETTVGCAVGALLALSSEANQVPFAQVSDSQIFVGKSPGGSVPHSWNTPPHPDNTGHLVFDTVAGLLKHRPNIYYRNGHNVVPATISPGTLIYHGSEDPEAPSGYEWASLDADHSLGFSYGDQGGYHFTFVATRELRMLHFDGSSAANMGSGTIDSQDIVLYGNVTGDWRHEQWRIERFCEWGKKYNIDGILRMEYSFEIMYCNFTEGLRHLSTVEVVPVQEAEYFGSPQTSQHVEPIPPRGWTGRRRTPSATTFESLLAGNWHDYSPLPGVRLDYSRLLSFYNPKYTSLVEWRRTVQSRNLHRLQNMSLEDARLFQSELHDVLSRPREQRGSGVAWDDLIRHIVERHFDRLEWFSWLLRDVHTDGTPSSAERFNATQVVIYVRQHVLTMLSPYLSTSDMPPEGKEESVSEDWLAPAIHKCSSWYTEGIDTSLLTPQEEIFKTAIEQTTQEICRTLGVVWLTAFSAESASPSTLLVLLADWKRELDRLKEWLGWSLFLKCDPACGEEEICTIPQWPFDGVKIGDEDITPHCLPMHGWIQPP